MVSKWRSTENRTITNSELYQLVQTTNVEQLEIGVLLLINDSLWSDGIGNGKLMEIFLNYEEAKKRRQIFTHDFDLDDPDEFISEEAFCITIRRLQPDKIVFEADDMALLVFDVISPAEICFLVIGDLKKAENEKLFRQ